MKQEIMNFIYEDFFRNCKDKIVKKEKLEDYLMTFTKDDLLRLSSAHIFITNDMHGISKIYSLRNKSKKEVISYIKKNLDRIVEPYFEVLDKEIIIDLSKIQKSVIELNLSKEFINIRTLLFLKNFSLAKINYDNKSNKVLFYIPDEIISIFQKCTKNKELINKSIKNNELFEWINGVLDAYGIIPLDTLINICIQNRIDIEKDNLENLITTWKILDKGVCTHRYNCEILVANASLLEEEQAISFYENTNKKYKILTAKQYQLLAKNKFYQQTKEYKQLYEYLNKYFELDNNFTNEFDDFIIMDYIYSAQLSREVAKENFYHNIDRIFENLTKYDKDKIHDFVFNIFKEYPKWYKNGNK